MKRKQTLKKIGSLILALCTLGAGAILFSSCSAAPEAPEGSMTRVTVDINPSVEFFVDDQNKVVSVTALNDDGSILLAGEAVVGKTPEEATELIVKLAADTGYLVSGNVEATENTVSISVSGNTEYAEYLNEQVAAKAEKVLTDLDIEGQIAKAEALKLDALRTMAAETSLYTEEELAAMNEEDLYKVLAAGRIETALLLTAEMREAYYNAKEYEISFAEREETARVIDAMGGLYSLIHTGYKTALDFYSSAITALDDFRYDTLVSPESEYQKSLAELREKKTEYLKQRNYTASLDINGEEYASATLTLQLSEENYDKAVAAYEALGAKINESLEKLIATLREAEAALIKFEDEFFSDDIKAELQAKAGEIEANLNAKKDAFFADFEAAHKEDIQTIEQNLIAKKQDLMSSVSTAQ